MEIKITERHSSHDPQQSMSIVLNGGSPWYGYVWIDDVLFTIFKDGETDKIEVERPA